MNDYEEIYPKIKLDDEDTKEDYKIEVRDKKSLFKKIKLLPSGDERNFKETNLSVEAMWEFSKFKMFFINKLESISKIIYSNRKNNLPQDNIQIQTITKNNFIKDISVASKKIGIISPIIPRKIRNADDK